jgi:hypothetical protein
MTSRASLPVLHELLDEARGRNYEYGVLGVRAQPEWPGTRTFTHDKVPVRIVPCQSALVVREALLSRAPGEWLIVLTDRTDEDLGSGILSHLIGHRLRTPDPWAAVRYRFAATGIAPDLTATTSNREVATGLLAATPPAGWPTAPGAVLTRDYALGAVAAVHLDLSDSVIDISSVLAWTADPALAARISDLRALAGDAVTDAVLEWAAGSAGAVSPALLHLLRGGEGQDAVPLGLVAGALVEVRDSQSGDVSQVARDALIRLEPRMGGSVLAPETLKSWAAEASAVVTDILRTTSSSRRAAGQRLLARADELLIAVRADGLADSSDLLPSGLTRRFAALAAQLRAAVPGAATADPDRVLVKPEELGHVERAWARVAGHHLAGPDRRTRAFHAAVRLVRWLATGASAESSLPTLLRRHGDQDAWAESAINDAAAGVSDPELGAGLAAVLSAAWARRAAHDATFAEALAARTRDDPDDGKPSGEVLRVEDLLPGVIIPLALTAPVLLLVLDGMSAAAGAEIVASISSLPREDWAEALLTGRSRRAVALAALPTVTEVSRASLLCGELRVGGQDVERSGFAALARAHGLVDAPLFHKGQMESARPGHALADDVETAIADITRYPLVACVLNTIDDALDRSDPGGIAWGADTVKHLAPLLDRARLAGRVVILTADHGHVIERRQGTQRSHREISSSRSRAATTPAGEGEVVVVGSRVLLHEGTAVLAVDENLRYGPVKSGYHGGASPSEVVVPVSVLVSGMVPEGSDLRLAPPQEPAWWVDPILVAIPPAVAITQRPGRANRATSPANDFRRQPDEVMPTLFDDPEPAPGREAEATAELATSPSPDTVVAAVLKSSAYTAHKRRSGRVSVTDAQVGALLTAMLAAPSHRLAPAAAATALGVSPVLLRGAVLQSQQVLNVEGYAVLRVDADGATLILDVALLKEQYGIRL